MTDTKPSSSWGKRIAAIYLALNGVLGVIFGGIHAFAYFSTGASISLSDAVFNAAFGVVGLVCVYLVFKGKALVLLVQLLADLGALTYAYAVGRGFNTPFLITSGLLLAWLVVLWRRGELS